MLKVKFNKIYSIIILLISLLTSSLFIEIFKPFILFDVEKNNFIYNNLYLEIIIFLIVNFIIFLFKNIKSYNFLIFLSIFAYIDEFKIYMLIMTIIIQYYFKYSEKIEYTLIFITDVLFIVLSIIAFVYLYKYTILNLDGNLKYIFYTVYSILFILVFFICKNEILEFDKKINGLNILFSGVLVYLLIYLLIIKLPKNYVFEIKGILICENIKEYADLILYKSLEENISSYITVLIMYLVYEFNVKILSKKVVIYLGLIFTYSIINNLILINFITTKNLTITKIMFIIIITIIFLKESLPKRNFKNDKNEDINDI